MEPEEKMPMDVCDICGGQPDNGMGRHKYAAGCLKYLSGVLAQRDQQYNALVDLMQEHGAFAAGLGQRVESLHKSIEGCATEVLKHSSQLEAQHNTTGQHTKWLNEINSRIVVHEAKHKEGLQPGSYEQHQAEVIQAKQEGYSQGYTDAVRRFSKAMREVIGDDQD